MFVDNGGEIMTIEDYDFLTSTMLKIVDLDSKKNGLNSKLKIAKNKVAVMKKKFVICPKKSKNWRKKNLQ